MTNYRSRLRQDSISSESDVIVLTSDEDNPQIDPVEIKNKSQRENGESKQVPYKITTTSTLNYVKDSVQINDRTTGATSSRSKSVQINESMTNHRSRLRQDSTSSESEDPILSSNEDEGSYADGDKTFPTDFTYVTQNVYDQHTAEIKTISDNIKQYQELMKYCSQLPDRGEKIRKLAVKLNEDLVSKNEVIKHLRVKEPTEITTRLRNISFEPSINVDNTFSGKWNQFMSDFSATNDNPTIHTLLRTMQESLATMPSQSDLADQPRLINAELMTHQRQALAWLTWREQNFPRGGILGDDMGLGKTLSMISLIVQQMASRESKPESDKNLSRKDKHIKAGWLKLGTIEIHS